MDYTSRSGPGTASSVGDGPTTWESVGLRGVPSDAERESITVHIRDATWFLLP
jgi:hypothetical protein